MLEWIKSWVITIATAVIFITAVEMILPNNNLKKYVKFVTGLILMAVLLDPLIKLFNNPSITTYINNADINFQSKNYNQNYGEYKQKDMQDTLEVFQNNLKSVCENELKVKYPNYKFEISVDSKFDEEKGKIIINSVKIGVLDNKVASVEKVVINSNENSNESKLDSDEEMDIKNCLSEELKIPKGNIEVYKGKGGV